MVTHSRSSVYHGAARRGGIRAAFVGLVVALAIAHATDARAQQSEDATTSGVEIVMRALSFLGVPYRLGGEDPARGFDCSGLVRYVVDLALGLDLPRRSEAMRKMGHSVTGGPLAPGDLLFFNTLGRPFSHVGLYIGDGRFVHAPARGGQVRIESMQIPYWRKRFNGARRVSPVDDGPA
ncbi:MAG: C40 family peptidase, partial [Gemmatimonadota bacterium]